jgi:hypothetical protein
MTEKSPSEKMGSPNGQNSTQPAAGRSAGLLSSESKPHGASRVDSTGGVSRKDDSCRSHLAHDHPFFTG